MFGFRVVGLGVQGLGFRDFFGSGDLRLENCRVEGKDPADQGGS